MCRTSPFGECGRSTHILITGYRESDRSWTARPIVLIIIRSRLEVDRFRLVIDRFFLIRNMARVQVFLPSSFNFPPKSIPNG